MRLKKNQLLMLGVLFVAALLWYAGATGRLSGIISAKKPAALPARHAPASPPSGSSGEQKENGGEQEDAPAVEIPEDKQQMIGVRTVEVAEQQLSNVLRTVGRVEYDERRLSTVNVKIEGWIEKLMVDYTGRYVRKGEPLAEVYSPELIATQQELINAVRWMSENPGGDARRLGAMLRNDSAAIVEAARQRLRLWDISEDQIRRIEESGRPFRTVTIYSPVSGYVVQKMVFQGMRVTPGEKLFDLADLGTVWIVAEVYENELGLVREGQHAKITLSYFPGKELNARIEYVYPALSSETRTAKVRFTVANPGLQLKPQMFTNVEVILPLGKRLAVPEEAVLDTGTRQVVYVDKGEGYFEPREVKVGVKAEGLREILSGLKRGERVASSAIFLIDSEAQLKGVRPASGHKH
ncbi:MAG: efflux RND transporter periplasmic adaptor subunit [Thermodesulfovibrionales bacterium]